LVDNTDGEKSSYIALDGDGNTQGLWEEQEISVNPEIDDENSDFLNENRI
jgi:hypothetical protein